MATKWVFLNGILIEREEYDRTSGVPTKPKYVPRSLPCIHLGLETGEKYDCYACGGGKHIPIHACSLLGHCTTGRRLLHTLSGPAYQVPWCRTCSGYYNDQEPVVPEVVQNIVAQVFPETTFKPRNTPSTFSGCTDCCGNPPSTNCCNSGNPLPTSFYVTFNGVTDSGGQPCSYFTTSGSVSGGTWLVSWNPAQGNWSQKITYPDSSYQAVSFNCNDSKFTCGAQAFELTAIYYPGFGPDSYICFNISANFLCNAWTQANCSGYWIGSNQTTGYGGIASVYPVT